MKRIIFILFILFIAQVLVVALVRTYVIQAFKIPAGSMLPTLEIGDRILINKTARSFVQRGDIIVFKYPEDPERDFIKRVIGVPGDTLQIVNKQIYLNGKLQNEPYVQHTDSEIKSAGYEPRDNFGPIKIPEGKFFVLGDNRDQSYDSRYFGFVPKEFVKGKAFKIYWSWDAKKRQIRWERIGQEIMQ